MSRTPRAPLGQGLANAVLARYRRAYPELAAEFERRIHRELPAERHAKAQAFVTSACGEDGRIAAHWATRQPGGKDPRMATREASRRCLNAYGPLLPALLGGSADLMESNCTDWAGSRATPCSHPPCASAWPSRRGSEIIGTSPSGSTAR